MFLIQSNNLCCSSKLTNSPNHLRSPEMKTAIVFIVVAVITLAVVLPTAQGLQCYSCIDIGKALRGVGGLVPDTNCKKGTMTDDALVNCTVDNTYDYSRVYDTTTGLSTYDYDSTSTELEFDELDDRRFACIEGSVTTPGLRGTTLRVCSYFAEDFRNEPCQKSHGDYSGFFCFCFTDKCNSGPIDDGRIISTTTTPVPEMTSLSIPQTQPDPPPIRSDGRTVELIKTLTLMISSFLLYWIL